jgi:hypothetical protein
MKTKQTSIPTTQDSPPKLPHCYAQNKPTQIPTTNCTNNTIPATSLPAIAALAFIVADGEAEEEPDPEAVVAEVEVVVELAEDVVELLELPVDDVATVEVLVVLVKVLTVRLEETTTAALKVDVTVTAVPVGDTTTTVVEVAAPEPRTAPPGAS